MIQTIIDISKAVIAVDVAILLTVAVIAVGMIVFTNPKQEEVQQGLRMLSDLPNPQVTSSRHLSTDSRKATRSVLRPS